MCFERRSRLLHEIATLFKHTRVSHTVIHEFAESLRDNATSIGVVRYLLNRLALQELSHCDDSLHKFSTCFNLIFANQLVDPEVLLADVVLDEEASRGWDESGICLLILFHHVVFPLHFPIERIEVIVLRLHGAHVRF